MEGKGIGWKRGRNGKLSCKLRQMYKKKLVLWMIPELGFEHTHICLRKVHIGDISFVTSNWDLLLCHIKLPYLHYLRLPVY